MSSDEVRVKVESEQRQMTFVDFFYYFEEKCLEISRESSVWPVIHTKLKCQALFSPNNNNNNK